MWEKNLPSELFVYHLIEWVRSISHRVTQKNRHTKAHKDSGPSPDPSPGGKGSDHRDTPMANHQHLTTISQHPSLAVMLCELCMPEAFCGLETVRKKALLTLWALWEINLPSVRENPPQRVVCVSSHRVGVFFFSQIYTEDQNTQRPERWWPLPLEGVSKLIHPLFILPLPCLRHNSLFTAAMLLISYKMIYWALNSLYKLV